MATAGDGRLRWGIIVVLLAYFVVAGLFALQTPRWQAPDEPAHFNYVRHVVETGRPPVLQEGCWDQAYLERLKRERFPADLSIEGICYEGHQPPLYYYLAAGPYLAAPYLGIDPLYVVRLFSVLLGAGVVLLSAAIVREVFPESVLLPVATAGVVAAVPMHMAILGSVNNDALANLVLAAAVWTMLRILGAGEQAGRRWLFLGLIVGVGLITKTTVYIAVPLVLLTGWWAWRSTDGAAALRNAGLALLVALLIVTPWLVRNSITYGGTDLLGLQTHDEIVVGQPRTADWVDDMGVEGVAERFVLTTFHSFWGQFGWMAAPLPDRFYLPLWLVSGVAAVGLVLYLIAGRRRPAVPYGLALMVAWIAFNVLAYAGYNVTFVQHQGRYLFPSLPAIALLLVLGTSEWITPRYRPLVLAGLVVALYAIGVWSLIFIIPGLA